MGTDGEHGSLWHAVGYASNVRTDPLTRLFDAGVKTMARRAVLVDMGCGSSQLLEGQLAREQFEIVRTVASVERIRKALADRLVEAVFLYASSTMCGALETLLAEISPVAPMPPIVLVAHAGSEELAIVALRAGLADYIKLPVSEEELTAALSRVTSRRRRVSNEPPRGMVADDRLIGASTAIRAVVEFVRRVAPTDANVLITGETGTGKEIVASLLHRCSRRNRGPLVCVNCAAIPDTLLESELFGHEKGAFTGAGVASDGHLRLAHGGTVFFDEIGEMTLLAQAKILRAIETKLISRLGGRTQSAIDIRVVAATNQNLETAIDAGSFRKDLYFRLNVARVHLPALRERREDIPLLIDHFLSRLNARCATQLHGFADAALPVLCAYDWPGNVRELRNVVEAAFVSGRLLDGCLELPEGFGIRTSGRPSVERERLLSALSATNWNKSKAAKKLHWSRMTLYRKMAKYQVAAGQ